MADINDPTSLTGNAVNRNPGAFGTGAAGTGAKGFFDWSTEDAYWRDNYATRPYARADRPYDYYQPAYKYGWESRRQYAGRQWNDVEGDLERGWDKARGASKSTWQEVKDAVRDAWHHVERALPGDADRDGR